MADKDLTLRFKVTDQGTVVLDKISQKIGNVGEATKKMSDSLTLIKWDSIVNLGARALQAGERFYDFGKSIVSSLNDIDRQAKVLGMATDQFQKWQYAAKMSDVNAQELATGFKFLSRNMSEASQGSGGAYDAFKAMGLGVKGVAGNLKPLNDMMKEVMDKFAGWADGPEKIAIALALFGRSGEALIPLLNKGSAGFAEFASEAEKLGIILGKDLIEGGSKAEDIFKKLEVQTDALKLSLAPVAAAGAGFLADLVGDLKWAYHHVKALAGEMRALKEGKILRRLPVARAVFDVEEGGEPKAPALINEAQRKQISEMKTLIANFGWEDYAAGADAASEATRKFNQMLIETRGPIEELENAFKGLGVESSATIRLSTDITLRNLETVKKAFKEGKATALDYANSLKAATSALEKTVGPDTTKKMVDAYIESQKKIEEISRDDPDRKKKIQAIIDDWVKVRQEIQTQKPISITADISQLESAFNSAREKFEALRESISSRPIEIAAKATLESSPKVPFSKGIENMILKFGSLQGAIKSIEANIKFAEFAEQLKPLTRELAKVRDIVPSWQAAMFKHPGMFAISPFGNFNQAELLRIKEKESDLLSQINIIKMKSILSMLNMYGGSFQKGIDFVPRTGLYVLHRGEQVKKAGDVNMGGITINVSGGRGREVAEEVIRALKYHTSRELRSLI